MGTEDTENELELEVCTSVDQWKLNSHTAELNTLIFFITFHQYMWKQTSLTLPPQDTPKVR